MSTESASSARGSTLQLIAKKLRSQILLFGLAISLVIVALIKVAGVDSPMPVIAVLVIFCVAALTYVFGERSGTVERPGEGERSAFASVPDQAQGELSVEVWVKHSGGSEREAEDYRVGDKVRVCARASRDCYLTLLNLSSDGELTILFPNKFNQNNWIRGGATQEVPSDGYGFNILLEEPAGMDEVKAIVTLDPKPLLETQFTPTGEFFQTVAPTGTARAMRVVAEEVKRREEREWAAASTRFLVKPK